MLFLEEEVVRKKEKKEKLKVRLDFFFFSTKNNKKVFLLLIIYIMFGRLKDSIEGLFEKKEIVVDRDGGVVDKSKEILEALDAGKITLEDLEEHKLGVVESSSAGKAVESLWIQALMVASNSADLLSWSSTQDKKEEKEYEEKMAILSYYADEPWIPKEKAEEADKLRDELFKVKHWHGYRDIV